ncbi:MAG: glycosyltransferase family 2 protein, partial [Solirubrobacteraceae bacterium]
MSRKIVLLGMMAKMPVPGVLWQTLHYLLGLQQLGFEPWYVEANARTPTMLMQRETDDGSALAAALIERVMHENGLADHWAYHALHDDGRCYGLSEPALRRLYGEAEIVINLHGGSEPRPEFGDRLVYLETDPVRLQIELHDGVAATYELLDAHSAFFTFAENLGGAGCGLPLCERFDFRPTRQPVVLDRWPQRPSRSGERFTTVGNWHQGWRQVTFGGETFGWSKDEQWRAFLDLPARTGHAFELALSGYREEHRTALQDKGWAVRPALDFGIATGPYRDYITGSRGEFTVAKDQNVRLRSGWFSDRSATYLAAGRPVVTQDTGFGCALPTGEGLFAVTDIDEATAAIEAIAGDEARHRRAARAIADEHFDAARVLGDLLAELGIKTTRKEHSMTGRQEAEQAPTGKNRAREHKPLSKDARVLALIPHFECEEWLDDALESLAQQTRPLDGIVVIDDASDSPPTRLVQRHPGVTLLHADRNVGPYRLVQQVIEETGYDAYLFQDADDWSAPERLEKLLAAAEQTGAELIGTQEMRVFCDEPEVAPIPWPLDIEAAFRAKPTAFPLLHPTSLVSRDLVMALGGFASGLRFSGDAEFLRRARYVAKVANISEHLYFRRIRRNSLTTARATGLKSPERERVMELLWGRARSNAELAAAGQPPDLTPIASA